MRSSIYTLQNKDYNEVKAYFELVQSNNITALNQELDKLKISPYTEKKEVTALTTKIAELNEFYSLLNIELQLLKDYERKKNFDKGNALINALYHPNTLKFLDSPRFINKKKPVPTNELFVLIQSLNKLHQSASASNDPNVDNVCISTIELMVDIIDQHQIEHRSPHKLRTALGNLATTIKDITAYLDNPQDQKQFEKLCKSINVSENSIENGPERFTRKRPALAAFLSATVVLVGAALFFAGFMLFSHTLPLFLGLPLLFVPMTAAVAMVSTGLASIVGITLKKYELPQIVALNNQLYQQNEKTAASMRLLVTTKHSLFAPTNRTPIEPTNDVELTAHSALLA